jgi:Ca2+:H+ antiporter
MSSLMAVSSASLIIPATLYAALHSSKEENDNNILLLSHGTSIILLGLYILYLYFQLYSHAELFDVEAQDEAAEGDEAEHKDGEILSPVAAGVALVIVTVLVAVCAEYLVDSIDSIVETAHISKTFIGLVLIPIVGNAAEHVTAVIVAYKGKMDLAINVAIGSSLQIALFVTPFLVVLGWIIGQPMTLHFQGFETVVLFISVLVVNYLIQDGKSNYLEGAMCIGTYVYSGASLQGLRGTKLTLETDTSSSHSPSTSTPTTLPAAWAGTSLRSSSVLIKTLHPFSPSSEDLSLRVSYVVHPCFPTSI